MSKIQTNASGTRSIEISEEHLQTIDKYNLLKGLVPSNGIVDETTLESLRHTVKSLILSGSEGDCKDLADLAFNVLYHNNMKTYGLKELIMLYVGWKDAQTLDGN